MLRNRQQKHTANPLQASREKRQRQNDNEIFAALRQRKGKPTALSGTFGCPNAQATASQPKEPSFFQRTVRLLKIHTFYIIYFDIKTLF